MLEVRDLARGRGGAASPSKPRVGGSIPSGRANISTTYCLGFLSLFARYARSYARKLPHRILKISRADDVVAVEH